MASTAHRLFHVMLTAAQTTSIQQTIFNTDLTTAAVKNYTIIYDATGNVLTVSINMNPNFS